MTSKFALFTLTVLFILSSCAQTQPSAGASPPSAVATSPTHLPTSTSVIPQCTQLGQQWISPIDRVTLFCVPTGEFLMGAFDSDPNARPNEIPQHRVNLDAFWIDRTEATNASFAFCVAAGACRARPTARGTTGVASLKHLNYYYDSEFANYPVLIYQAEDAQAYCAWAGRRLPTEAEWEKAARGTDARQFPWGEGKECTRGSFFGCTEDTTAVDTPLAGASPYGALNMAGNVWEWVADQYASDYYANSPSSNPTGPAHGQGHVRRGGGWRSLTRDLRVTARESGIAQHYMDGQMGFRCAMSDRPQ